MKINILYVIRSIRHDVLGLIPGVFNTPLLTCNIKKLFRYYAFNCNALTRNQRSFEILIKGCYPWLYGYLKLNIIHTFFKFYWLLAVTSHKDEIQ